MNSVILETLKSLLIEKAKGQVSNYSQYENYFDNWGVIQLKTPVKTKLGLAFDKDEVTIGRREFFTSPNDVVCWSFKTKIGTRVTTDRVSFITV